MIVYKVLVNVDGKLYSSNKRNEVAKCLQELYVEYKLHEETKGISFNGVNSKLFAFTSKNYAVLFFNDCSIKHNYGYTLEIYKCLAFGCSANISPLRVSVLSNINFIHQDDNYLLINDKQTFNESFNTNKDLAINPEAYWKTVNQIKKSHKKLKRNYRLVQNFTSCVACDVIIPVEKVSNDCV